MKIAIDFDGVLHSDIQHKGSGNIILDPPVDGAIEKLRELLCCDQVEQVFIFSLRCAGEHGIAAMIAWLNHEMIQKFKDDCVLIENSIKLRFTVVKPHADVFIDDRALPFNGNWNDPMFQLDNLLAFKPWTYSE